MEKIKKTIEAPSQGERLNNIRYALDDLAEAASDLASRLKENGELSLSLREKQLARFAVFGELQEILDFVAFSFMKGNPSKIGVHLEMLNNILSDAIME